MLLALGVLAGLAVRGPLQAWVWHYLDKPARHVVLRHTSPGWKRVSNDASLLGSAPGAAVLAGAGGAWWASKTRSLRAPVQFGAAYCLALVLALATKVIVRRSPASGPATGILGGSYPSDHAVLAAAVLGTWAALEARSLARPLARRAVIVTCAAIVAAVAVARIYLLAHYASDVLAGLVLGAGSAAVAVNLPEVAVGPLAL